MLNTSNERTRQVSSYDEMAQRAYAEAQQQAAFNQTEYDRRQAVWQSIVDSGPGAITHICDWARNQQGFSHEQLYLWFYRGTYITVDVGDYTIQLNLDGTVTAKKSFKAVSSPSGPPPAPQQAPGFPGSFPGGIPGIPMPPWAAWESHQNNDPYGGLPELPESALQQFMEGAVNALAADIYAKLNQR